jgi:hypothetical protein
VSEPMVMPSAMCALFLARHDRGCVASCRGGRPGLQPVAYAFVEGQVFCYLPRETLACDGDAPTDVAFEADGVDAVGKAWEVVVAGTASPVGATVSASPLVSSLIAQMHERGEGDRLVRIEPIAIVGHRAS